MITLRPVTPENFRALLALRTAPHQRDFVADNVFSLAEAFALRQAGQAALPFGLYDGDTAVGFAMFGSGRMAGDPKAAENHDVLVRFMIGEGYQGRGLGREALAACLAYLRTRPMGLSAGVWLSYAPENHAARRLYASAGFRETGETCDGEVVAVLDFATDGAGEADA